jgi:hypothetical protein
MAGSRLELASRDGEQKPRRIAVVGANRLRILEARRSPPSGSRYTEDPISVSGAAADYGRLEDQPDADSAFPLALTAPMTKPAQLRSTESGAGRNEARDDRAKSPRRPTVDQLSEWSFPASDPPGGWTWEPSEREDPPAEHR